MSLTDDIEVAYPLSPMQEGMLFNSLYAIDSGVDIEQMVCGLYEPLSFAALERAWARVAERHDILRTSFRWENLAAPAQEVHRTATVPFVVASWEGASAEEAEARLRAFLKADRLRGFDLTRAPLMRVTVFTRGESEHLMVWTFHHALLDGRSFPILLNEVFQFHEAFAAGSELDVPLPRPYRDYIRWREDLDIGPSEAFFREALKGFTVPTQLPAAHPAPEGAKPDYSDQQRKLSPEATAALLALARQNQLTMNTLVQGAWALLLARYGREEEVVFGVTRACRRSALGGQGTDGMVGIFINTLPLRVPVRLDEPVIPWLKGLRARWNALRDHEHTPLVQIRTWCDVPASLPLFDTLLVYEEYLLDTSLRAQGGGFERRDFRLFEQTNFPITLAAYGGEGLTLKLEYDRRRFSEEVISRMLGHLEVLLAGMAETPDKAIGDLPLLTAEEHQQLVYTWNDKPLDYPRDLCMHELIAEQMRTVPDAPAVSLGGVVMSYRELELRTNRVARFLKERGVGPDVLVGVCLERKFDLVITMLAVMKAGGAYVPLDHAYPKARIASIISDAKAPILVTQRSLDGVLPEGDAAERIYIDEAAPAIAATSDAPVLGGARPEHLAYVIYTSGSTGRPKGVAIEHRAGMAFIAWVKKAYTPREMTGVVFCTSVCFDLSIFEVFATLAVGGKVIVAENALHILSLAEAQEITFLNIVPSAMAELLKMGDLPDAVETVNLAGEPLQNSLAQQVYARSKVKRIYNMYGPTEDTTYSTYWHVPRGYDGVPSVGKIVENSQYYILDSRMHPVPIGVFGEGYISGEKLSRGYLNRPELTAERYTKNPFVDDPSARLYRTGDVIRYREDGNMDVSGRVDFQVKVRGFRIELGEIETVLAQHPDVRECVVIVREDKPGDKRIVAYTVAAPNTDPTPAELRAHVEEKVPEFMIPSAFVRLDKLPQTLNSKVDRKALPAPDAGAVAVESQGYVAPSGHVEQALCQIFGEVLGLPANKVSTADSFFTLGGHSILALRVVAQIEKIFGKKLNLAALFDAPTVAALAEVIRADGAGQGALIAITVRGKSARTPLFWCGQSYAEVMVLARALGPEQPLYSLESTFYNVTNTATHVVDFATRYVEEVVKAQPEGPYLIGGFCIDAYIALEIAEQLQDRGKEVSLLVLVERDGPGRVYSRFKWAYRRLMYPIEQMQKRSGAERVDYVMQRLTRLQRLVKRGLTHDVSKLREPAPPPPEEHDYGTYLTRLAHKAVVDYHPRRPYTGKVAVFYARETLRELPTLLFPHVGWRHALVGATEVTVVDADHDSITVEPAASVLADHIRKRVEAACETLEPASENQAAP
jgi:amino acid adenylation domain-containing protein